MCQGNRFSPLVNGPRTFLEYEVFHASVGKLLAGLAEQHHEHDPLDLFHVDIGSFQRKQPVDKQLALRRRQDSDLFEVCDVAATTGIKTLLLEVIVDARAVRGLVTVVQALLFSFCCNVYVSADVTEPQANVKLPLALDAGPVIAPGVAGREMTSTVLMSE